MFGGLFVLGLSLIIVCSFILGPPKKEKIPFDLNNN